MEPMDLIVGVRLVPFVYLRPAFNTLWINDGNGISPNQTALAPQFQGNWE